MIMSTVALVLANIFNIILISLTYLIIFERTSDIKVSLKYKVYYLVACLICGFPAMMVLFLDYFLWVGFLYVLAGKFGKFTHNSWLKLCAALYSVVIVEITARFLALNIFAIIYPGIVSINDTNNVVPILFVTVLQCLGTILINEILIRLLKMNFGRMAEIKDNSVLFPILKPTVSILSAYYAIQWLSYNLVTFSVISEEGATNVRKYLSLIFMVSVLLFIAALNQRITVYLEGKLARQREEELKRLTDYNHRIEHLYRDIRSFRHDYTNILISLRQGIDNDDMASVRKTFNSVLAGSEDFLQSDQFGIAELSLIDSEAIKSVLVAKLHQADSQGISVNVEVIKEIGEPNFPMLDFIRVLTILLDNAIEAAAESENKWLSLSYFYDKGKTVLIIENSMSDQPDSLDQLYRRGISSKGETRGWGLAIVRELLATYPHASLKTSTRGGSFRQIIEINDKS